jgi:D-xylose 1-dehydrogenase (NADP+, D-xylono-1,5-lactone-forming)
MTDVVRWGILSTSDHARKVALPGIAQAANCRAVAVASRDVDRARAFADELGIPRSFGSYDELLADSEIDAVYLPLPVSLHSHWALRAADAGKPVLCEKPLSANADQARTMTEAFASRGLLLREALMYRYHPLVVRAQELVRKGGIGEIRMVHAQFNASVHDETNIRMRRETGGGSLLDVGCYCTSVMRYMTGEEPVEVSALARLGAEGVDEGFVGTMRFGSGVLGHFGCGMRTQFDCSFGVCGSTGRVLVDWGAMCAWPGEAFRIRLWRGEEYEEIEVPPTNSTQLLFEDFAGALLSGGQPRIPAEDAVRNMEALDRLMAAAT